MDNLDDLEMDMMSHRHDWDHPMSHLYEHDGGYRGAVRRSPGNGGRVTCKHCGNNRLRWKFTTKGWRTFEGGVLHKCPAFSGGVKISSAPTCSLNQPEIMKDIESQAMEYAEALNDIADVLNMPTGATAAEIVQKARDRWANGIHTCHERCTRERCVERRKLKAMREALETVIVLASENPDMLVMHVLASDSPIRRAWEMSQANTQAHPPQVG